ncbi:RNA polymerase I-specific transcription initiation factor rrn7 [Leucoagaricus sp. SymC.cos]|nr:RNA polymerase I-specific transcription initiation factor rrn7 [Leucoagaricus sp. SymC.cos]
MAPRRRCPTCGSRQWHKEPLSGLIACSEGHVLQNYRSETNEVDHNVGHVMNRRKLKSTSKRKEQKSNANPQLYHGARGRYHYFVCQQFLLRMQVETITKLWNLPPEFEVICRDIWSLHLSLLRDPPPPEPYSYLQDQEHINRKAPQGDLERKISEASTLSPIEEQAPSPSNEDGVDQEDAGETEKSDSGDDSEMEELLRQNSEISSSSDEGDQDDPSQMPRAARIDGRRIKTTRIIESPASALAVMMVALWQLRIPVMYQDLARVIESYELPYLDPIRFLPSSMVAHLTKHSIQALSPHHVPSTLSVHKLTARLARRLNSVYDVFTPECNAAPLLWRLTKDMEGTPTLYALTKRVAYILKLPLTLHSSLAPGLRRVKVRDPEHHKYDNVPPEVALMATIIIVLKMTYGLDGKPRSPDNAGDPALALPRADKWLAQLKELDGLDAATRDALFSSENVLAVGDLSETLLDEYLRFCEHALLGQDKGSNDIIVTNHFPVSRDTLGSYSDKVKASRPITPAGVLVDDLGSKRLRPAEQYTIWNPRDVFGTVAEDYGAVLGRAARWIRTGEDYLSGVVELYERRFVRWWEDEKRREKGGNGSEEG